MADGFSAAAGDGGRRLLPVERRSITHAFSIGGHKGRVIAACYPDGRPGEVFIAMAKQGSPVSGLLDALGASVSIGLQHGVALSAYARHMKHMRFEPAGWTGTDLGFAHSVVDYVFRWLELQFPERAASGGAASLEYRHGVAEGETCAVCGAPQTWGPGEVCPDCGTLA